MQFPPGSCVTNAKGFPRYGESEELVVFAIVEDNQLIRQSTSSPFSAPAGTFSHQESLPHAFDPASPARDSCQSTS